MNISCTASHCHLRLQVLIEVGGENVSFSNSALSPLYILTIYSNSALSPLYIPSWPPGEHLLSGVASRAGKCKIRPADERLTIISIHNGSKICQIFPDLNIPEVLQRSHILHSQRGEDSRLLRIPKHVAIWIWLWQLSPFDWNDCDGCHLDIETIGRLSSFWAHRGTHPICIIRWKTHWYWGKGSY